MLITNNFVSTTITLSLLHLLHSRGEFVSNQIKNSLHNHVFCLPVAPIAYQFPPSILGQSASFSHLWRKGSNRLPPSVVLHHRVKRQSSLVSTLQSLSRDFQRPKVTFAQSGATRYVEEVSDNPLEISRFCWQQAYHAIKESFHGTLIMSLPNSNSNTLQILQRLMEEFSSSTSGLHAKDQIDWHVKISDENQSPGLVIKFQEKVSRDLRSPFRPFELDISTVRMKRWVKRVIIG